VDVLDFDFGVLTLGFGIEKKKNKKNKIIDN